MELTRSQKRIILMIADAVLIYFSGFVAYFFLSEYVLLSDLSFVPTLTMTVVLYFLIGIKTKLFSIINRYTDYKTLSTISLTLVSAYFVIFLVELALSLHTSYRFLLLSCMFSILFTMSMRLCWRMWFSFKNGTTYTEVEENKVSRTS